MSADEIELGCSESEILLDGLEYTVALIRLDRISLNVNALSDRELKLITFSLDNILCDIWDVQGSAYHLVNKENAEFYLLTAKSSPKDDFIQVKRQLIQIYGFVKVNSLAKYRKTCTASNRDMEFSPICQATIGKLIRGRQQS